MEKIKIFNLTGKEIEILAEKVGASPGYLIHLKYTFKHPTARMAELITKAAVELWPPDGRGITETLLLYPERVLPGIEPRYKKKYCRED